MRPRALDLFCGGGGVSEGLLLAGFDVVGVDLDPKRAKAYMRGPGNPERHERPAQFVQADALQVLDGLISGAGAVALAFGPFDFVWASPPCQAHSVLRKLCPGREYPDLIPATRERLVASGIPYAIENVPGAPMGGFLTQLCGTMFGLQAPDGRAELRRHRLFETSWPIALRPACRHGFGAVLPVTGHTPVDNRFRKERDARKVLCVAGGKAMSGGMMTPQGTLKRRAISIVGSSAESKRDGWTGRGEGVGMALRETFSVDDARHAMGIDWMAMKDLSQAIPPAYSRWIGERALEEIRVSWAKGNTA